MSANGSRRTACQMSFIAHTTRDFIEIHHGRFFEPCSSCRMIDRRWSCGGRTNFPGG